MLAATKPALCPSCLGLFGPVCSFCDLLLRSSAVCRGFLTLLGMDAFQNLASAKSRSSGGVPLVVFVDVFSVTEMRRQSQ